MRSWKPPHTGLSHDADVSFCFFCLMSWCLSWRSWCAAALKLPWLNTKELSTNTRAKCPSIRRSAHPTVSHNRCAGQRKVVNAKQCSSWRDHTKLSILLLHSGIRIQANFFPRSFLQKKTLGTWQWMRIFHLCYIVTMMTKCIYTRLWRDILLFVSN
jgi:hypothetical protein